MGWGDVVTVGHGRSGWASGKGIGQGLADFVGHPLGLRPRGIGRPRASAYIPTGGPHDYARGWI